MSASRTSTATEASISGAALETVAELPGVDPEELLGLLREWFATWAGEGLFAAVEFG